MRRRTALVLVLGVLAVLVAGCGGGEEAAPTAEEVQGTVGGGGETATQAEETQGQETEGQEGQETEAQETGTQAGRGSGADEGDPNKGKPVYASAGCGGCHIFKAGGSTGTVGPNLDESDVDYAGAVEQIRNGGGGMPPFKDQLSEKQIKDVAAFVVAQRDGG